MHKQKQSNSYSVISFTLFFVLLSTLTQAQKIHPVDSFRKPVDIPIFLSGNFGELRSSHFHTGIDIKTQGKTGVPLHAIEDGWISRIGINAGGYGNVLYLEHPNGYTSVYAHMDSYTPEVAAYILNEQYAAKRFEVNLYPEKNKFPVKKGDIIGKSGNSGRSGGPHLHFEIRDSGTEQVLNPQLFYSDIKDNLPPKIFRVSIYPANYQAVINGKNIRASHSVQKDSIPVYKVWGQVYFGIEAEDFYDGSQNRCGIYSIQLRMDSNLVYETKMNQLKFSEARNILSYVDYATRTQKGVIYQKSYQEPNNQLGFIAQLNSDRGIVNIFDNEEHTFEYTLSDIKGNTVKSSFILKGNPSFALLEFKEEPCVRLFKWDERNTFDTLDVQIDIPEKALFDDLAFDFTVSNDSTGCMSKIINIHRDEVALLKGFTIRIPYYGNYADKSKLLIARVETSKNKQKKFTYVGGKWDDAGFLTATSRNFGSFTITADSVKPEITDQTKWANLTASPVIQLKALDRLSGIASYEGKIDGEWVLFRYDEKSNTFIHRLTERTIQRNKKHKLSFEVIDNRGNSKKYEKEFTY